MVADPGVGWRRVTRSVRFRITALATLIVVAVLVVTGFTLLFAQRRSLTRAIDDSLRQRADDLESVYASGELPPTLGVGADETLVQVVAPDGAIIAASGNVSGLALPDANRGVDELLATVTLPEVDDDPFRLLTRRLEGPEGDTVLSVGGSLDDVRDSASALGQSLLLATPVVAALLAAVVWWLVGRSLQPVEAIRTEVASIGGAALHRRVPVPDSGDEIERLARTMNRMLDRVEDASDRQQRFVADASHELRSPLTRMRSELEVDTVHPTSADLLATHRSVLEEIVGLDRLLDDLLFLARSDAGEAALEAAEVDLVDVVAAQVETARGRSAVEIEYTASGPCPVVGDGSSLGRAVANLLDNAIRHAATRIRVGVERQDGRVVVTVADDGPGIPEEAREFVFERFARLDEARHAAAGGTGLGLAIVRDIAVRHGGTVRVDADSAGGARFAIEVPVAR